MAKTKPVLITLTSPSCAGKSYLFNYIRDVAKLPCLISTTTRARRFGEEEGIDYYFISQEESLELEKNDQFAELVTYNGARYGVTRAEFEKKLSSGMAFLIVEPNGIDHYVKPALDAGAGHLKYYVHTDPEVRLKRFKERVERDITASIEFVEHQSLADNVRQTQQRANKTVSSHINRLISMLTEEMNWGEKVKWDRTLMGVDAPEYNLEIIRKDVNALFKKLNDV